MKRLSSPLLFCVLIVTLSLALAMADGHEQVLKGWLGYAVVSAISAAVVVCVYRRVAEASAPSWLPAAVAIACILRLGMGLFMARALPVIGRDVPVQEAGYIFYDAYARDRDAFALGRSDASLLTAFTNPMPTDQYGGLGFLSALVYRTLSQGIHRPLLIVVLAAAVSSLSVVLTWGFASLTFGNRSALFAAWVMALYPDGILLGASQMREAFIITAMAGGLYGYALLRIGHVWKGLVAIVLASVVLALPISPPFTLTLLAVVCLAWLWEGRLRLRRSLVLAGLAIVVGLVAVVLAQRAWSELGNIWGSGFRVLVNWWRDASGQWQVNLAAQESAWIDYLFAKTPDWMHIPMMVGYGLVRPFLPAALMYESIPIWRWTEIWRALGWFVLLPFLIYAALASVQEVTSRRLVVFLAVLAWVAAIVASYRGFGDQWDNPRYRAVFLAVQASVAGWAWAHARRQRDPWLGRVGVLVGVATILFSLWYAGRYRGLPWIDIRMVLGGTLVFSLIFVVGSFLSDRYRRKRSLTRAGPGI